MTEQTIPLAALVTNFGGGLPAGMLLADGSTNNAFDDPCHQVWRRDLCWDAAGRWRRRQRLWWRWSPCLTAGSLWGC